MTCLYCHKPLERRMNAKRRKFCHKGCQCAYRNDQRRGRPRDIPATQIEQRFQRAKAWQRYERVRHQGDSLGG